MKRTFLSFDDTWRMRIDIPVSRALRCGELVFLCGQCDLDSIGNPAHPNDLQVQSRHTVDRVLDVLTQMNAEPGDIVHLHVFYRNQGTIDEQHYRRFISKLLPVDCNPVIVFTPVPHFFYPGLMVEIDAIAMVKTARTRSKRMISSFPNTNPTIKGLRSGRLVFIKAHPPLSPLGLVEHPGNIQRQTEAVMNGIASVLSALGADLSDVVKLNSYFVGANPSAGWREHSLIRGGYFDDTAPVVTDIPLPWLWPVGTRLTMEAIAWVKDGSLNLKQRFITPQDHWVWPAFLKHSQGVRCGELVFVGGQLPLDLDGRPVASGDMVAQTHMAMQSLGRVLSSLGADWQDLVKVNTYYQGESSPDDLHANLSVRCSYFKEPGPASTGMPVPNLTWPGVNVSIDAIAIINHETLIKNR